MKEKPYVKVAMYALNIIFAIIIIVPVVYCFNVSMMDLKEIYGGKFWPSHLTLENYTRAFQLAPFFTFIKNSLIVSGVKSPTNCDAHLAESLFQTRFRE